MCRALVHAVSCLPARCVDLMCPCSERNGHCLHPGRGARHGVQGSTTRRAPEHDTPVGKEVGWS